jgi:hypothetical protein
MHSAENTPNTGATLPCDLRDEFLRDGDRLAAHMTGTIKLDGFDTAFESFIFAKVEKESGKLEWMIERSVWGPARSPPEHGVK